MGADFYDPGDSSVQCGSTNGTLTGSDNTQKAFNYFKGKGLTNEQSAGILGNMTQESSVNPERVEDRAVNELGAPSTSKDPTVSGRYGWGLIQWTPGSKIINSLDQAGITTVPEGQPGRHVYDLDVQLDLVWWHLENIAPTTARNVLPGLKETTTVEQAVLYFEQKVEGAGNPALGKRLKFAKQCTCSLRKRILDNPCRYF